MKFRLLMACVMGFITPTINAKMETDTDPFPVFEIPTDEPIDYYKDFSMVLLSKIKNDIKTLLNENQT